MGNSYYHRVQKHDPNIMQKRRETALKYYYNTVKKDEIKYVTMLVSNHLYTQKAKRTFKQKKNPANVESNKSIGKDESKISIKRGAYIIDFD